jgi:hypothetical protein
MGGGPPFAIAGAAVPFRSLDNLFIANRPVLQRLAHQRVELLTRALLARRLWHGCNPEI